MGLSDLDSSQANGPAAPLSGGTGSANSNSNSEVGAPAAGDGSSVVIIGLDPADAASLANLPPGNRWGDFSIAPGGGQPGSAGGRASGSTNTGAGGSGPGGDHSVGVGPGEAGGGGGKAGSNGALSIAGGEGNGAGAGMLDPSSIVREMVFAVPSTVTLRKNALIVSAGPMGGGGLDAYGALHCGKIYTVFLAMPGKGWTLQFCQSGAPAKAQAQAYSSVVHLEQGILPPDAETRFDFKRLPVPFEKKNKMIVLKGVIKEDGTVDDLKIYQSIVPAMDDAARQAFSRWKFKPALRDGKPVAVDILVGVPPELPTAHAQ